MWFYIFAALVLYVTMTQSKAPPASSPSHDIYTQMVDNGEDADTINLYMEMEDALVKETNPSVALALSMRIKETFPEYDFGYHTTLIKIIAVNYSSSA